MTKKDYIKFAAMLNGQKPVKMDTETTGEFYSRVAMWNHVVHETADIFAEENSRFDRQRFLVACGYTDQIVHLSRINNTVLLILVMAV